MENCWRYFLLLSADIYNSRQIAAETAKTAKTTTTRTTIICPKYDFNTSTLTDTEIDYTKMSLLYSSV